MAEVSALVDEADFQSARRRLLVLQRKADDDMATGVKDVVRDRPVDFERALVLRKFFLVHHEGEGPEPHRVGIPQNPSFTPLHVFNLSRVCV